MRDRDQKLANLKTAFERFLTEGDTAALAGVVRFNRCRPPRDASYPAYHRLCDFVHGTTGYRVTRLVTDDQPAAELIFIQPFDVALPEQPGVPYHLHGEGLRRWIRDEINMISLEQSSGGVDWNHYLDPPQDPPAPR